MGSELVKPSSKPPFLNLFFFLSSDTHSNGCGQGDSAKLFMWPTGVSPENYDSFSPLVLEF